jgi:hypothetical protein
MPASNVLEETLASVPWLDNAMYRGGGFSAAKTLDDSDSAGKDDISLCLSNYLAHHKPKCQASEGPKEIPGIEESDKDDEQPNKEKPSESSVVLKKIASKALEKSKPVLTGDDESKMKATKKEKKDK